MTQDTTQPDLTADEEVEAPRPAVRVPNIRPGAVSGLDHTPLNPSDADVDPAESVDPDGGVLPGEPTPGPAEGDPDEHEGPVQPVPPVDADGETLLAWVADGGSDEEVEARRAAAYDSTDDETLREALAPSESDPDLAGRHLG